MSGTRIQIFFPVWKPSNSWMHSICPSYGIWCYASWGMLHAHHDIWFEKHVHNNRTFRIQSASFLLHFSLIRFPFQPGLDDIWKEIILNFLAATTDESIAAWPTTDWPAIARFKKFKNDETQSAVDQLMRKFQLDVLILCPQRYICMTY